MQTETVNNSVVVEPMGNKYKLRFDDIVVCPSYYRFELQALEQAASSDEVSVTINSDGGSLATGIEVANAIFSCQASVEGVLRSSCHSCGSIIFLACNSHDVGLASEMLLHSGSGGTGGTPTQAIERAKSYKRQVRALFETVYQGFLSPAELDQMIEEDKEFIFCGEDIVVRLESMYKYREGVEETYHQEMEDSLWEQNNVMVSEAISSLDISQSDKDTFNRVKDLLDKEMMMGSPEAEVPECKFPAPATPEETPLSDFPSVIDPIYAWTEDISVEAFNYPEDPLFLFDINIVMELELKLSSMIDQREEVIHFLREVTGKQPSRKKATKTLALELIALATKFIIEVEK
tara:strand:+ start:4370 stop:5413 length:1044 start_codon:yes stop_codon:yes gene_type:complete